MGKKSLIKSTSKKTKAKAKDEETKTKTKKTASKATKSTKTKKTTTKKTVKAKAKTTAKKTASKARKTTKKKTAKKPSLRQLLLKKFEAPPVEKLFSPPAAVRKGSAPPLIDTSDKEKAASYRELLARSFSMKQVAEAARKAAEEKAAREKAEAEKKAAEEAAAKKAAEEAARKAAEEKAKAKTPPKPVRKEDTPEVKVSYEKEAVVERKEKDPVESAMKLFIAGLAFLILLVVGASINNSGKYYIKEHDGAIEITKGKFAPLGEKHFITLPGVKAPEVSKEVFSRKEVYPLIFGYYLEKADNLLQSEGLPDFEGIKAYLEKALAFATGNQMRSEVYRRIDNIDRIVLMYKAEVAMSKDTPESLEEALGYLQEAKTLAEDEDHKNLIEKRIERVKERLAALEAEAKAKAEAEAAAAAEAESEAGGAEAQLEGTEATEAAAH